MRIGYIAIISIACALAAAAQEKITVPLTNPAQPVTIRATMISGSIRVTAGSGPGVSVTTSESTSRRGRNDSVPPGMKRIGGQPSFDVEEDHNVVTINGGMRGDGGDLTLEVPVNTSLQLKTVNGGTIEVTGVSGDHEIENINGSIKLTNVGGSVVAHSQNGEIVASLDHVTGNKPMSFTSMNGRVDVTLPGDTKARLKLKSNNGSIYSDFDVKVEPDASKPVVEDSRSKDGKYRISVDKGVTGTINGGGPEYTFQTMNGNILIHKK